MIPREQREVLARVANCVRLLAANSIPLYDTSVTSAFKASEDYAVGLLRSFILNHGELILATSDQGLDQAGRRGANLG